MTLPSVREISTRNGLSTIPVVVAVPDKHAGNHLEMPSDWFPPYSGSPQQRCLIGRRNAEVLTQTERALRFRSYGAAVAAAKTLDADLVVTQSSIFYLRQNVEVPEITDEMAKILLNEEEQCKYLY